jgi:hypothetical protein
LNISGATAKSINGSRILHTAGTTTWTGAGGIQTGTGAVINNDGMWDCQNDVVMNLVFGGTAAFNNALIGSIFQKSVGTATTQVQIPFNNAGNVQALAATLQFSGGYTQTAGATTLNGGAVSSTTTMNINGGIVSGFGTMTANATSAGIVTPGLSPGILNEAGNYTQTSTGGLNIELGGLTPGTQYDQFNLTGGGVATLSGALNVSLITPFVPADGNTFTVMTYASHSGAFVPSLPFPGCIGWFLNHGSTSVVLTAATVPRELTGLTLLPDKIGLAWDAGPIRPGTLYDVDRGDLDKLPVGPGPDELCLAQGLTSPTTNDPALPATGHGYWYLVRERFIDCGKGTYGFASNATERVSTACP